MAEPGQTRQTQGSPSSKEGWDIWWPLAYAGSNPAPCNPFQVYFMEAKEKEKAREVEELLTDAEKKKLKEYEALVDIDENRKLKLWLVIAQSKPDEEKIDVNIAEDKDKTEKVPREDAKIKEGEDKEGEIKETYILSYYNPVMDKVEGIEGTHEVKFSSLEEKVIEEITASKDATKESMEEIINKEMKEEIKKEEGMRAEVEENIHMQDNIIRKEIEEQANRIKDMVNEEIIKSIKKEEEVERQRREKLLNEIEEQRRKILKAIEELKDERKSIKERLNRVMELLPPLTKKRLELFLRKNKKVELILLFLYNELNILDDIKEKIKSLKNLPASISEFISRLFG